MGHQSKGLDAVLTFYILAFLAGAPAGRSPLSFAYGLVAAGRQASTCAGAYPLQAAARWCERHPGYVVVGTRCQVPAGELPA